MLRQLCGSGNLTLPTILVPTLFLSAVFPIFFPMVLFGHTGGSVVSMNKKITDLVLNIKITLKYKSKIFNIRKQQHIYVCESFIFDSLLVFRECIFELLKIIIIFFISSTCE